MLTVHFLNVGHGDCTIIRHPSGRLTMIDVNNCQEYDPESLEEYIGTLAYSGGGFSRYVAESKAAEEITSPIEFIRRRYPGASIFRFILTHPDLDHMRGLESLFREIGVFNFWDTHNTKPDPNFRSDADRADWQFYQRIRAGNGPLKPKYYTRGDRYFAFALDDDGQSGGDNIEIMSPSQTFVDECNRRGVSNDLSLVLRVTHAGRRVLFPGDIEDAGWAELTGEYGGELTSDFLKASHHGRDTGYNLDALRLIKPAMVFTSVGRKPSTDASHKYRAQCNRVASTRFYGDLTLSIADDGSWKWYVQRNADR